jgi:hypothetical protein
MPPQIEGTAGLRRETFILPEKAHAVEPWE